MPISAKNQVRMLTRERERLRIARDTLVTDARRAYPYVDEGYVVHEEALRLIDARLDEISQDIFVFGGEHE